MALYFVIISIDNELTMKTTDGSLHRFLLECKQINYVTDKQCEQLYKCLKLCQKETSACKVDLRLPGGYHDQHMLALEFPFQFYNLI